MNTPPWDSSDLPNPLVGGGAPVLFAQKKDCSLHLCVDFCGLNKITKKDCYPLPLISDLLDSPHEASLFSHIDLRHTYQLVWICEGDEWKTAFWTCYGSFEWCVMPFRLTNSPAAFQWFMNDIFGNLLDICILIYLDDILIYSNDSDLHHNHVREVLWYLRKHYLYAHTDQYFFHKQTVKYLGYNLSLTRLTMDPKKIDVIQDWPEPWKVKDMQSFLRFANFYWHFISNYSDLTVPLTQLTRKWTPWVFSNDCQKSFEAFKKAFTTAPILTHWIPNAPLIVETNASNYALAAILSTVSPMDNQVHPITFHSWTFNSAELNYNVHDKELLAIFEAFKVWHHYLEGSLTPVDIVTDHKNLKYFSTTKLLTQRQVRWSKYLSQFNLIIWFCPRQLGTKPDSLTQWWDVYLKQGESDYATINPNNLWHMFTSEQLTASLQATSLYFLVLHMAIIMDVEKLHSNIQSSLQSDPITLTRLDNLTPRWHVNSNGFLLLDNRIYIPDVNNLW